jgi:hypothetical protein
MTPGPSFEAKSCDQAPSNPPKNLSAAPRGNQQLLRQGADTTPITIGANPSHHSVTILCVVAQSRQQAGRDRFLTH